MERVCSIRVDECTWDLSENAWLHGRDLEETRLFLLPSNE
jgi:hypothetical protein